MFRCKEDDGSFSEIFMLFVNNGWVPVITVCNNRLYQRKIVRIPRVRNLSLNADGNDVSINWTPRANYKTEIQYRLDSGEWITLPLVDAGVGSA